MSRYDEDEDDVVELSDVRCIGATPLAIRVVIDGRPHWIPQSQIADDSEVYAVSHHGRLVITGWFARKEGLG